MSVIIKKKNECELHVEAEPHILYELQDYFKFPVEGASFVPAFRKKYWDGNIYLFNVKKQTIYAGLVYRLCKFLDKHNYEWNFESNDYYGAPYEVDDKIFYEGVELFMNKISPVKPREYQIQAVFNALKEYRKTIVSPTGSGKSLCIYAVARYLKSIQKRTLIVVPTKSLVEQLTNDFSEYGWNIEENVHKIYQGHSIHSDKPVTISTWQSIYGLDRKWFRQFDGVIGDECHQFKAKSIQGIMNKCADSKWRIGTTGTLDGKNVNRLVLEGLFGPVYKTTTSSTLMEKGLLAKLQVEIIILKHKPTSFLNYNEEIEYLCESEKRNQFICDLINRLSGNILVLYTRVEGHGIPLHEKLINQTDKNVHLIHGGVHVNEREEVRRISEESHDNVILGSYGTMSTGVNIQNISHVIFASPSKSRIRVLQSIGRGLRRKRKGRNKCMLYDISDDTRKPNGKNNFTLNHLEERIKYYIEESFEYNITEISL